MVTATKPGPLPAWASSPWDLRRELVRRIEGDLLGPLDGDDEVIRGYQRADGTWSSPGRVRDRYLVGMLAPKGTVAGDPERDDDVGPEDGDPTMGVRDGRLATRTLSQSSIGISAVVDVSVAELAVRCRWGRYLRAFEDHDDGSRASVWRRMQVDVPLLLPLVEGEFGPVPVNGEGVVLSGRVNRSAAGPWLVTVFLANEQEQVDINKDARWLFQAGLDLGGAGLPVFLGRDAIFAGASDVADVERGEVAQLAMQYRDVIEHAVGHGVGTVAEVSIDDPRRATRVATAVIPRQQVWRTDAPKPGAVAQLAGLVVDMKSLSELDLGELRSALLPLAEGYRSWLDDQEGRIGTPEARLEGHEATARQTLADARRVADAVKCGIDLVCSDVDALNAFRFANQAMWKQRVHTVAIEERRKTPELTLKAAVAAADVPDNRSWRPFQLAFVLLCIPSLSDPGHAERRPGTALADLLFFPTGGGKTEAYLGLAAYMLAMRRLQGVVGTGDDAVDGRDGVAVLMRYTLRLLTAQQFQRAATLMCAAELLRQHRATTEPRFAGKPFRLGMWVGGSVTPNKAKDAQRFVDNAHFGGAGSSSTPMQLRDCPWCGRPLDPKTDARYEAGPARFLIYCGDHKECPFTARHAEGEGIPVVTVDEEIYRLLPSFVIATIDKFAQLPWNGALSTLFGRVERRCERHGYRNADLDRSHQSHWEERDSHLPLGRRPAEQTVAVMRLRPPDLILQDEMHLVTGPLGTMAGLYETAIDRLATWTYQGEPVRPKLVASTATIRRARQQTWSVFWRDLRVFPPPVLDVRRTFYAEQVEPGPDTPGRLYLGVCAHGERLKQVELRVFATVMAAAQAMVDELGAGALAMDPWMTTVGYFNAVRELAGMRRMAEDELRTKLRRTRFTTGLANRVSVDLEELTSRVSSDDINAILRRLFVTHDPSRPKDAGERPVDLLLATNMISVGVDVPRFGSMIVVGQPKATAEYVQATSRVGRAPRGPGLVITLYNWARPRDLSHYETFAHYHATFYRHVEPLSVTPFSERALDRGLTGVLVAALRHGAGDWNPNPSARDLVRHDPRIAEHVAAIAERAERVTGDSAAGVLVRQMADRRLDAWDRETGLRPGLSYAKRSADDVPLLWKPEAGDWDMWTCPNSLRDTEVQVNLQIVEVDPTYESGSQPPVSLGLPDPHRDERTDTADDQDVDQAIDLDAAEEAMG